MSKLAVLATVVLVVVATALPAVANDRPDLGRSELLGSLFSAGLLDDFLGSLANAQNTSSVDDVSAGGDISGGDVKGGVSGEGDGPSEGSVSAAGDNLDNGAFRKRFGNFLERIANGDPSAAEAGSSDSDDGAEDDGLNSDEGSNHEDAVLPKVIQQLGNDNESGDVDLSFGVGQTGNNSNQAVTPLQFGNTGSNQNAQGFVQNDSTADDLQADGSTFVIAPSLNAPVDQGVQQASRASSAK